MIKHLRYFLFIFVPFFLQAQDGSYSPYSYYKFGDPVGDQSVENAFMGHLNFYHDTLHYNFMMPSTLANLKFVNYSVASTFDLFNLYTNTDRSKSGVFLIPYVSLGIPISEKAGIGFGFKPYSTSGFFVSAEQGNDKIVKTGEGGMNKIFAGVGLKIFKGFNLGISYNYYFGNKIARFIYYKPDVYAITRQVDGSYFRGFGFDVSADYQYSVNEEIFLQAGAYYRLESKIASENTSNLEISDNSFGRERIVNSITLREDTTSLVMPAKFSLGLGMGKKKHWFAGVEFESGQWSRYENNFFTSSRISYQNATTVKAGGFWIPDYRGHVSYWKRITYKAGFYVKKGDLVFDNQPVNEFGMSFGLSLPLNYYFSNVSVGLEYVNRGKKAFGLVQENIFKLKISLSFNDKWFVKRKIN